MYFNSKHSTSFKDSVSFVGGCGGIQRASEEAVVTLQFLRLKLHSWPCLWKKKRKKKKKLSNVWHVEVVKFVLLPWTCVCCELITNASAAQNRTSVLRFTPAGIWRSLGKLVSGAWDHRLHNNAVGDVTVLPLGGTTVLSEIYFVVSHHSNSRKNTGKKYAANLLKRKRAVESDGLVRGATPTWVTQLWHQNHVMCQF